VEKYSRSGQRRPWRLCRALVLSGTAAVAVMLAMPVAAGAQLAPPHTSVSAPTARTSPHPAGMLPPGAKSIRCDTHGPVKTCIQTENIPNNNHRVRPASAAIRRALALIQTPPPQCLFTSPIVTPFNPDRFTSCDDILTRVTLTKHQNGVSTVVGTFEWEDWEWVSYNQSFTEPDWIHGLVVWPVSGTGMLSGGVAAVNTTSACNIRPQVCNAIKTLGVPDSQTTDFLIGGGPYEYSWQEFDNGDAIHIPNRTTDLRLELGTVFFSSSPVRGVQTDSLIGGSGSDMNGRCDSVITVGNSVHGCVNDRFWPTFTYDSTANPKVAPVAQHIYDIQTFKVPLCDTAGTTCIFEAPGKGVDGWWPLTRDMNDNDNTANRRVACAKFVAPLPPDPNTSCDEYPFASTHQGAASGGVFDIRGVPQEANDSQGGITETNNRKYRVIDGDAFFVRAILPDGTASW
jgi:hypothetical protein